MDISVIISTYNNVAWLEKVLWSYEFQIFKNFEIVIADDGSDAVTKDLVDSIKIQVHYPIQHIWHPDDGFRKTVILNKATVASRANYLVYTDGDCIARSDFLEVHNSNKQKHHFLSGGYFKLPMDLSNSISKADIESQRCFDINWLKQRGLKSSLKNSKITSTGTKEKLLNRFTPTTASWNGHNSSGFKSDIIAANGFDERMQYGGEDRELGERLIHAGIRPKQIRYSAICLHLDHPRGYVKQEMLDKNARIRATTKRNKLTRTPFGIVKD